MTATAGSRTAVLQRIHAAVGRDAPDIGAEYDRLPRAYQLSGTQTAGDRVGLMIERLREYDADVLECTAGNIADAISAQIKKCERRLLVAPHGLPQEWLVSGTEWRIDDGLTKEQIEECDGAVTAAECGIADSGTIVLHHSPAEGRRLLSLLPDWHLCILRASQVVETLPQYFERYGPPPALATFISGPSATADIEMTRIKGVHGPRFLNVLMVRDE